MKPITESEARAILTDPTPDRSIIRTKTGFYKINIPPIGRGGWGSVYAAQHYSLIDDHLKVSEPLALKELNVHQSLAIDQERLLFQQAYPDHDFYVFTKESNVYLTMPLFAGVQLNQVLKKQDLISREERQMMAQALFIDLAHLHNNNIAHNDLKTKNILYDPEQKKMHIIDFGCAKDLRTPQRMKYQSIENSVFAFEFPPEYLTGALANASQDMYTMTPIIAEILGVDRRALVTQRLEKALADLEDQTLCQIIREAFAVSDGMEEALFTAQLYSQRDAPQFQLFVKNYTDIPYDFLPYKETLGEENFALLNAMQSKNPADRPSARDCVLTPALVKEMPTSMVAPPTHEFISADEFNIMMSNLYRLITTANDFQSIMKDCSQKQKKSVYLAVKDRLPTLMKLAEDYVAILSPLPTDAVEKLCSEIKPDLTQSSKKFVDIMKFLPAGHKTIVYNATADALPLMVKTAQDYSDVLGVLHGKSAVAFRRSLQKKFQTLIKSTEDFVVIMLSLNKDDQNTLCLKMKTNLTDLAKSASDFVRMVDSTLAIYIKVA